MLGFPVPQYGGSARADLPRFARMVEDLGADSLWVGADTDEHLRWAERLLAA